MDILVKHNGTNVTSDVISYEREHKICTGIGTLTIEFTRTTNRTFDPWDSIDIHENGDFKVRYYISAIKDSIPDGKITLDCQDLSKKLVDFFIPESYLIDYPSYTRYWIEFFLDMVEVDYEFETSSPGQLLSNFTSLGMMTVYEQLLVLLQLSGWYMFFDGNGKAIIGPLDADLADDTHSVGKTDCISVQVTSNDQMLRNRALVLGSFDVYSLTYATADVTVKTRWNYDRNDIRTMVVVNSNIPNDASAYSIANVLLKEFARITVEKRLEIHGARNYTLGDALRVHANVWRGKGLITTFGVRMSKDGLITDVILDERCPRLFGFFDYGDYVYVGTFGDGIWRKHIKFDPTWYNFSTGLTDLNITDLHINNGSFGSVGHSGQMYLSTGSSWSEVSVTSLISASGTLFSGVLNESNGFAYSGIKARATIVDKIGNTVKFGVDTWSGLNMGDYFLNYSGWTGSVAFSGLVNTSGFVGTGGEHRGWILEYDPYSQALVGGLGSGIYPVSVSGDYNIRIIDLENDGSNDFVSVKLGSGVVTPNENGYNMGVYATSPFFETWDSSAYVLRPNVPTDTTFERLGGTTANLYNENSILVVDLGASNERDVIVLQSDRKIRRSRTTMDEDGFLVTQHTTSTTTVVAAGAKVIGIHRVGSAVYRVYWYSILSSTMTIVYKEWNVTGNTLGSETTVAILGMAIPDTPGGSIDPGVRSVLIGDKIYLAATVSYGQVTSGGEQVNPTYIDIHVVTVNLGSASAASNRVFAFISEESETLPGRYYYVPTSDHNPVTGGITNAHHYYLDIGQENDTYQLIGWMEYGYFGDQWFEVVFTSSGGALSATEIYNEEEFRFETLSAATGASGKIKAQLTKNKCMIAFAGGPSTLGFVFNGSVFTTQMGEPLFYRNPANIHPLYTATGDEYIAVNGTSFYNCAAGSMSLGSQVLPPTGYSLIGPFANPIAGGNQIFWTIEHDDTSQPYLAVGSASSVSHIGALPVEISTSIGRGTNVGGYFVRASNFALTTAVDADYLFFLPGELEGARYLVLRREGLDYTIIQEEAYPIRIDISNTSPELSVGSGQMTFKSNYVYGNDVEVVFSIIPTLSGIRVEDYRYTLLEPIPSGALASGVGIGVEQMGLFISGSGIFSENIRTYSGGWQPMFSVPSGYGTRIETSSFGLGGQYIFITSSGFVQTFYQMNPGQSFFTAYSGMPQSRATIIRLDDRI